MHTLVTFLAFASALSLLVVWRFRTIVRQRLTTKLSNLPGPKSDSLFTGNLSRIFKAQTASLILEEYREVFGPTFMYRGILNSYSLCTFDIRAIHHVLHSTAIYHKPYMVQKQLSILLGDGVLIAEDEQHRRQRRVMNPAFGNAQLRELTEIFLDTATVLRDIWLAKTAEGPVVLDAYDWMSRATLDIIGKGGFGYEFNALSEHGARNELSVAFNRVFSAGRHLTRMIRATIPILRLLPSRTEAEVRAARATMDRIGLELVEEKKRALAAGEKGAGRDILSLLIQANMDKELPEQLRMTDEEVLGQIPTFLVAGHETTATAMSWCFFALSQNIQAQDRLREELSRFEVENPTMDQLNALPYLDAVVRETLRVYSVVPNTGRTAQQDDSIPLSTPYTDRNGRVCTEVKITKGDRIFIPVIAMNRARDIWGDNHLLFRPERWLDGVPANAMSLPGVLPGLLTFSTGPKNCIGYRFAMVEMKALLFQLVRHFRIELAVPAHDIISHSGSIVMRPFVQSAKQKGMPVKLAAL